LKLGARTEGVGFEAPGDFELVEVGRVDLIEGRVTIGGEIASVVSPFSVGCAGLGGDWSEGAGDEGGYCDATCGHEYDVTRSAGFLKMG
jgi:hypothetical protein